MTNSSGNQGAAAANGEESLAVTLNSISDAVLATDSLGRVTRLNPAAEQLTGWRSIEAIGRPLGEVITFLGTESKRISPMTRAFSTGNPVRIESAATVVSRTGAVHQVEGSASPIRNQNGIIIGSVLVLRDVSERETMIRGEKERVKTTLRFQNALLRIQAGETEDLSAWYRLATHECAVALRVGRVSIWIFDDQRQSIVCENLYQSKDRSHESGTRLTAADFPRYFEAVSQGLTVIAEDARTHPQTMEFRKDYLEPLDIVSMLDVPLQVSGELVGILCCESVGRKRHWSGEDVKFTTNIASLVMLAISRWNQHRAERALREMNSDLEQRISLRTAELASNEARFRALFFSQFQFIGLMTPAGILLEANQAMLESFGLSQEELVGRPIWDAPCWAHSETCREVLQEAVTTAAAGRFVRRELEMVLPGGSVAIVDYSIKPVSSDPSGTVTLLIPEGRDVTEQKRTERALRQSEELFRSAMEGSPIGMALLDLDGTWLRVNDAVTRLLGYTEAELLATTFQAITYPDDLQRDLDYLDELVRGKIRTYRLEKRYVHKGGHPVWGLLNVSAIWNDDGTPRHFISQIQDISEFKRAEEELRLAASRVQLAAQAGRIGIWEIDLQTHKTTWDPQMHLLYGLDPGEQPDGLEKVYQVTHPEDLTKVQSAMESALSDHGSSLDTEHRILHPDGVRTLRSTATVLRDSMGVAQRMIGISWDVTGERERERELARALENEKELTRKARAGEHAKSEFLAVMSHEIRTPMNGILGFAELIASDTNVPVETRDQANTIVSSGTALLRILDDILDLSSLEAGSLRIETSPFLVRELAVEIITLLQPSAQQKRLKITLDAEELLSDCFLGDPGRLRQILLNLLGNALKFTPCGRITLKLRNSADGNVELTVSDTGPGVAPERLEAIFEPFAQGDIGSSRKFGGTGLGLTISRKLARLMGGELTARSKLGVGTEFTVTLPLTATERANLPEPPNNVRREDEDLADRLPLRILVVEDDRINLRLVLSVLRKFGYDPLSAQNGAEAVEVFVREQPQVILMDLQMPERNGMEATVEIRQIERKHDLPRAYIAALTANTVASDRSRCHEAGMNGYLNKPLRRDQLAALLVEAAGFLNPAGPQD